MATKKNPLSALLRTDDRQQVQELQRDHVLRSAARQAGTYGVGVQKPLPISQTNLGRLSNSLGTVSGILAQFTAYQAQKEQVELKGQGLQHTLNMQELQSLEADLSTKGALIQKDTAHEVVKRQAIQLEAAQEDAANAEFDRMVRDSTTEQREDMFRRAQEQVRITRERAERARLGQPLDPYSPEFRDRSLRIIGSLRGADFADYLEAETQKALVELRKNDSGASLTREEAMDLAEDIRERYMELKELSLDDEIGRGFMNATERLRAAREPELANKLLKQSESINTENLIGAVKQWAEADPKWEDIERQEWYAQMTGMDKYRFLGALMGTQGNPQLGIVASPGVKGLMTQNHKGALQFQQLFNQMSEKYQLEGKPLKEYSGFDAMEASVEEAVERTLTKENIEQENMFSAAVAGAKSYLHEMETQYDAAQAANLSVGLVQHGDLANPSALRERINKRFPGLNIETVPDNRLPEFAMTLVNELQKIGDIKTKQTAKLVSAAIGNETFLDSREGAAAMVTRLQSKMDAFPGSETLAFKGFFKGLLEGVPSTGGIGLGAQGGSIFINKLDEISDGALSDYRRELNNLKRAVEVELPENATADQYNELYRTKYKELKQETERLVGESIVRHVKERETALEAMRQDSSVRAKRILEISKTPEFEGFENALTVNPEDYADVSRKNPDYTPKQIVDLLLERGKTIEAPVAETLNRIYANTPKAAERYTEAFAKTREKNKKLTDMYEPGGAEYVNHRNASTKLASGGKPLWGGAEQVADYHKSVDGLNAAHEQRIKTAIDLDEAKDIAEYAYSNNGKSKPNAVIVLKSAEEFVNILPRGPVDSLFSPAPQYPRDSYEEVYDGTPFTGIRNRRRKTSSAPEYLERKLSFGKSGGIMRGGEPEWHADWHELKRDIAIRSKLFVEHAPPVIGIPFDEVTNNKPPKQVDVNELRLKIAYTPKQLKQLSALFGFDNELDFFKSQYNNAYYYNQRVK